MEPPSHRVLQLLEVQPPLRTVNEESNDKEEEEAERDDAGDDDEDENRADLCLCLAPPKPFSNSGGKDVLTPLPISMPIGKHGVKRILGELVSNVNNNATQSLSLLRSELGTDGMKNDHESDLPPTKDRVVGWPPIRSYRRNTIATTASHRGVGRGYGDVKPTIYVKVNMDGIPIGRKVDLKAYHSYESLSIALEEMFHSPNCGYSSQFLSNAEFVLTYEDQDGDWMLVGDVPWGMFVDTVERLRIVRPSEATGASRATLK